MSLEYRFDSAPVGKNCRRDGRGFLLVPARVTRTGVFKYKRADGTTVHELRHPDDVFDPASLASLEGASVTELHPDGFVTPENAHQVEIGVAGAAARADGRYVGSELSIRRASSIGKVERRELTETSCSYSLTVDPTPGVYEGQRYDQRQRNIRYNHVALGPKGWGRAGRDVGLRMDAASAVLDEGDDDNTGSGAAGAQRGAGETPPRAPAAPGVRTDQAHGAPGRDNDTGTPPVRRNDSMKKIRIDGVEYEVDDKVAAAYEAERSRADGLQARVDQATSRADSAQGREDALRTQLTTAQADVTRLQGELTTERDPARRSDSIRARVGLERAAVKVLGEKERLDGLTDRQVREKAILKVNPNAKFEGRSDDYVTAQLDTLIVEGAGKRNDGMALVQSAITTGNEARADAAKQGNQGEQTIDQRLDAAEKRLAAQGQPKKEG